MCELILGPDEHSWNKVVRVSTGEEQKKKKINKSYDMAIKLCKISFDKEGYSKFDMEQGSIRWYTKT